MKIDYDIIIPVFIIMFSLGKKVISIGVDRS